MSECKQYLPCYQKYKTPVSLLTFVSFKALLYQNAHNAVQSAKYTGYYDAQLQKKKKKTTTKKPNKQTKTTNENSRTEYNKIQCNIKRATPAIQLFICKPLRDTNFSICV